MLLILCMILSGFVVKSCQLGETSDKAVAVTFDDLLKYPTDYFGKLVKITTQLQIVQLDFEGLWIIVQDPSSVVPQTLFVKGNEKWFHFPLDLTKESFVELEGFFHLFSFQNDELLLTPYTVLEINATSVNLVNESCKVWLNQIEIVDLDNKELEVPSAGAGKVCLKQSETEPLHSTEHSIEVINVIQNCVTLRLKRGDIYEEHKMCEGYSAYIPSGTPHMLINHDSPVGCYIYVHAVVDTHFGH